MTIFYTSDTHFGHRNILRYCSRPFASIEEHDEVLISNWNSVVGPQDEVYHLGDFSMGKNSVPQILSRLNGSIHLIWGNHDSDQTRKLHFWASSQPYAEIKDGSVQITLCHYAHKVWNRSHRNALHFYGHSHGNLPGNDQSIDVGVDNWDFTPVTLEQIKERLKTLPPYRSDDHHQPREM